MNNLLTNRKSVNTFSGKLHRMEFFCPDSNIYLSLDGKPRILLDDFMRHQIGREIMFDRFLPSLPMDLCGSLSGNGRFAQTREAIRKFFCVNETHESGFDFTFDENDDYSRVADERFLIQRRKLLNQYYGFKF